MKKEGGLRPEHHGDLNRPEIVYPGGEDARKARITELRQEYAGDTRALQQIDVYEGDNEYSRHMRQYVEAMKSGNLQKQQELEEWFHTNYPDL